MLTFVGLGLYDEKDVSVKALEAIKNADVVYGEFYTSKLMGADIERLERFYGRKIKTLTREEVEDGTMIIEDAKSKNVVFIVPGDSLVATTHISLRMNAKKLGIKTSVLHGASIISSAPSLLGLQHYKFGRTVSIPHIKDNYFPTSPYRHIAENYNMGLHTLILLDTSPPMSANEAMEIILKMEEREKKGVIKDETLICVVARAGSPEPLLRAGFLKDMLHEDFGSPLHTLVIPGELHFMEKESLVLFANAPREILNDKYY